MSEILCEFIILRQWRGKWKRICKKWDTVFWSRTMWVTLFLARTLHDTLRYYILWCSSNYRFKSSLTLSPIGMLGGEVTAWVRSKVDIGVIIDDNLSFNKHIDFSTMKSYQRLGSIWNENCSSVLEMHSLDLKTMS